MNMKREETMNLKFWRNTLLQALVPGGIGYRRFLRRYRDSDYKHDRDKSHVREKHQGKSGWQKSDAGAELVYRDYGSYAEYVEHQKSKFFEILKINGGFDTKTTIKYRLQFLESFRDLHKYLPASARILCAGARQGTEVEVLRELGFSESFGIDLNPGPENPLVRVGDFLKIDEADSSLDLIYSNAVDHAFNLDDFFLEHVRVIKPEGFALYDIALQEGGVFEAVHWKADEVVFQLMLQHFASVERVRISKDRRWKSVLLRGKRV
jgi:hypothetical protein